ncbi:hypothetical protein GW915_09550 [bacterium]|nr:hypothetical protein [bacterium]
MKTKNKNLAGFSVPAAMLTAAVLGIAAASLPALFGFHDTMKEKMYQANYASQIERVLRRKYGLRSAFDFTNCPAGTLCRPIGDFPKRVIYNIPACTTSTLNSCQFVVNVSQDNTNNRIKFNVTKPDGTPLIPPTSLASGDDHAFEIPYPESPANGNSNIICNPRDPATLGKPFLMAINKDGEPTCEGFQGTTGLDMSQGILAECPTGSYLSYVDISNRKLVCNSFSRSPSSCPDGEYIDKVEWSTVPSANGPVKIQLNISCAARRPTI